MALLCDNCNLWFHIQCVQVSDAEYAHFYSLVSFNWVCTVCLFHQLPNFDVHENFSLSVDTSINDVDPALPLAADILTSPLSDGVQLIHHNIEACCQSLRRFLNGCMIVIRTTLFCVVVRLG